MAVVSLGFTALFGLLAVAVRAWLHAKRTGRNPFRGGAGLGGVAAVAGNGVAFAAGPVLDLAGVSGRLAHGAVVAATGLVLAAVGLGVTLWAQLAMGDAWRIGVDPDERTRLVTNGPFTWVRNPIYTAMIVFAAGLALMVPNVASVLGFAYGSVTL